MCSTDSSRPKSRPKMFILFVLSHGDLNGKVYTDYPLKAGADKSKLGPDETENYFVSELWDGLKIMPLAGNCLFLLMLGVSSLKL
jgi:hypothetical protein